MKLAHAAGEYRATLGGEVAIPLSVSRVAEFHEPLKVELVPTEDQAGLISTDPLSLSPGDLKASMTIRLKDDPKLVGEQSFLIRATALQQGKWLVKSETTVVVDVRGK